jgi:hypothetical protein
MARVPRVAHGKGHAAPVRRLWERVMMRTAWVAFLASVVVSVSAVAGDLNPPAGAVAPTMKTLQQVEPRIPLSATTTPGDADSLFRITQPGSYYLTGNVSVPANFNGIEVGASGFVTIDLSGFAIIGNAGSLYAIRGLNASCHIFGGGIRNTRGGIYLDGGGRLVVENMVMELVSAAGSYGVIVLGTTESRIINTSISGAGGVAIGLERGLVSGCTIACPPGGSGINLVRGIVERCTVRDATVALNVSEGVVRECVLLNSSVEAILSFANTSVERCMIVQSSGTGVFLVSGGSVSDTTVIGAVTAMSISDNGVVSGCTVTGYSSQGFSLGVDVVVERSSATSSTGTAFNSTASGVVLRDCVANGSPISLGNNARLSNVTVRNVTGTGVTVGEGSVLTGCRSSSNTLSGFLIGSRSVVTDCLATSNSTHGFAGFDSITFTNCRAESNFAAGYIFNDRCTFTACSASLNGQGGYSVRDGATFMNCYASDNGGDGFFARFGSRWESCTSRSNTFDGIEASSGAYILNCVLDTNGQGVASGANIRITGDSGRIEGNSLIGADFGIQTTSGGNVIVRNNARNNTNNYGGISPGNDVGPIGTAATATSPWANIQ